MISFAKHFSINYNLFVIYFSAFIDIFEILFYNAFRK